MIASPNYVYGVTDGDGSEMSGVGAPGSAEVEKVFQDYFSIEVEKPYIEMEIGFGSTDYTAFIAAGIPFGDIYTGSSEIKTKEQVALFGGTAGIQLGELSACACLSPGYIRDNILTLERPQLSSSRRHDRQLQRWCMDRKY